MLLARSMTAISAAGTMAPDESRTVPRSVDRLSCPEERPAKSIPRSSELHALLVVMRTMVDWADDSMVDLPLSSLCPGLRCRSEAGFVHDAASDRPPGARARCFGKSTRPPRTETGFAPARASLPFPRLRA